MAKNKTQLLEDYVKYAEQVTRDFKEANINPSDFAVTMESSVKDIKAAKAFMARIVDSPEYRAIHSLRSEFDPATDMQSFREFDMSELREYKLAVKLLAALKRILYVSTRPSVFKGN